MVIAEKFLLVILVPLSSNSPKLHPEFELCTNLKYLNRTLLSFLNVIVFQPLSTLVSSVFISFHVMLSDEPWNFPPLK